MVFAISDISISGSSGARVPDEIFGVNSLFHSLSLDAGSDYNTIIQNISPSVVRYPGGTVCEEYFDISDPDRETATNVIDEINGSNRVREQDVIGLTEFLANSETHGLSVLIVLPTYRFFNQYTRMVSSSAEAEIKGFIRALVNGDFGDADISGLEIGNEWYQHRFNWSAEEFAALQFQISVWIEEAYEELGVADPPDVFVQGGRTTEENTVLSDPFGGDFSSIDGVITHLYVTNSNGNPLAIGSGIANRLEEISAIWSDLDIVVSEWSVGEDGELRTVINGIMRFAPLMRTFVEMLEHGVDIANIWSIQTPGPAGLSGLEGSGSNLSPTGLFFSLLSDTLRNALLIELEHGNDLLSAADEQIGYQYLFQANNAFVLYLASGISEDATVSVDVTELVAAGTYIYATVLSGAPGDTGEEYRSEAAFYYSTRLVPTLNDQGRFMLDVELGRYEFIQLHFSEGVGVDLAGDPVHAIGDEFVGSNQNDLLDGRYGDDSLDGSRGNDTVYGGTGSDTILGGGDHDFLFGGSGDDSIQGEHGRDSIDGGLGDDLLEGGSWHDTITGGNGRDTIIGGRGNDIVFGGDQDDLFLVEEGEDSLWGGRGFDTIEFLGSSFSVWLSGIGQGTFGGSAQGEFYDVEAVVLSENSDYIVGAEYLRGVTTSGGDDFIGYCAQGDDFWRQDVVANIHGGSGFDVLSFEQSSSGISLSLTENTVETGSGHVVFGGIEEFVCTDFDDYIYGSLFSEGSELSVVLHTGGGRDTIYIFSGAQNQVYTGRDNDFVFFDSAGGEIFGGEGNDIIFVSGGSCEIYGGTGDDRIVVNGLGTNLVVGGGGDDSMVAGAGDDTFLFDLSSGNDTIAGFGRNGSRDVIDLQSIAQISDYTDLLANHVIVEEDSLVISAGENFSLELYGISLDDLGAEMFLF